MRLSPNEVNEELQRVENNNYQQFIKKIVLRNVRGFHDESVEFRFPVTALIGTNGGGKSTILGCAALAYKNTYPRNFFPKAFAGDEGMANWSIEYELVDRGISNDRLPQRTARFAQAKWRRDEFPSRHVEYVEIQRTVPAGELSRFRRFISGNPADYDTVPLSRETIAGATAVLDKNIEHYRLVRSRLNPTDKMYIGSTPNDEAYSQFHFGAGEASVIETIDRIESSPDNALVLIEEVENGLHPVAVQLFVHYLQRAARRKRLQIIFTTHSQEAVDELPAKAVWASINKRTWNGKLSIHSLRAITGQVEDQRAIYVEDEMAREWIGNAVGRYASDIASTTKIFPAGGYPNCVKVSEFHNSNPMIHVPSIALVDGDIYDPASDGALPEHASFVGVDTPETLIFDYIYDNRRDLSALIRQRCLLSQFDEDRIVGAIEGVRHSGCDSHEVFAEMSRRLDFISSLHIRAGLVDLFNERNPEFWRETIDFVRARTGGEM